MRVISLLTGLFVICPLTGLRAGEDEWRWSFDSLPAGSLVGDATVQPIGPTAGSYQGLPETNVALQLDGNGDYVRVPDNAEHGSLDFAQGDPITIEAWVRLDRIGDGQNVYVVGKGRTHQNGHRDNQNYALRLRGVGRSARLSFLFRSQAGEDEKSNWHRWTSDRGFRTDGSWHHLAVAYRFGDPETIRGYVDGKPSGGKWDMGGQTKRAPVVDDDDLWIGSSMAGAAGNSFAGAIDEVVIARRIIPARAFANRRVVITHPPQRPAAGLSPDVVHVTLHEDVGSEGAWPVDLPKPLVEYQQSAFGISQIPVPYGPGGVRRDWKGPVMVTAMAEVVLPPGEVEWMLRAGGLSRFWIDDTVVAETPAHLGNSSGHGEVVHYEQQDPWLRPPRAGHFEEFSTHRRESVQPALVTLQTMIGGEGLRYEAGEIMVAYRTDSADPWQVLSLRDPITVTDDAWETYAAKLSALIMRVDDQLRRLAAADEDEDWNRRHEQARQFIASLPPIAELSSNDEHSGVNAAARTQPIDRLINGRLADAGRESELTERTSDEQFLRRLYLDCVGVVPNLAEIEAFGTRAGTDDDSVMRREQVIDRVLQDPRWADHWTAYWLDVLAENPNVLKPSLNNSGPFRWYLYDAMRDNVAVDRWVTNLLRMQGSALGGGPAGFAMAADNDVPMAAKAHIVTSAFLAANMKCARCHDAPYHDWTQRDLFSVAAMLARKPIKIPASSSVPKEFFGEEDEGASLITLSLSPGEEVESEWLLASYTTDEPVNPAMIARPDDSRETLAYHVTRVENRQFAKTIVNRLWQRLMGEGIVEPVDDWEGADPSHPKLLDYLSRELAANGFDLKHVARLILRSNAYQRRSVDRPVTSDERERLFAAPRQRRMTAEQLVDSMHVVVGRSMDADELTFDPEARMRPQAHNNLGLPTRAWQLTSLSNERDRPALSLPRASAVTDCLEAFGWKGARQEPINYRQTEPNVIQPGILAGGLLSIQLTRLTDGDELTSLAIDADSPHALVDDLFQRFLTRLPEDHERSRFTELLDPGFDTRVLKTPAAAETPIREPSVSWANHLHPQATEVRLRESARLRQGPPASRWLEPDWRERLEDAAWALINTPEFLFIQ